MSQLRQLARASLVALALAAPASRAHAQPAPYHRWRTLETPHFRVHVAPGLEREGRVAGAAAEHAYAQLARELVTPRGTIDLVVSDDVDYSNGFATPYPSNRIVVFATPPVENAGLRLNEDWLGLVVTHELTHIFHLDRARGIWGVAQHVFGRSPFLFPNSYAPSWIAEGLAVYYESRLTKGGRLNDAQHELLARAGAIEHRMPRLDQLSVGSRLFPGGTGVYAYGSLFIDYLARTRGDSSVPRFVERSSGQLVPLLLDRAARQGFGVSFSDAYDEWRDSVQRSVGAPRAPLDGWRELTAHGFYAMAPRWLDDSSLVYSGSDGRETNAAYRVTTSGVRTRLGRRDSQSANVPLADGGLLFAQPDLVTTDEMRSDLYVARGGRVTRLTRGARLVQPDARADGTIVAVRLAAARASLVLLDREGRLQRVLREAGPDETWSEPRWSPDGKLIATVHRRHGGEFSIEALDLRSDRSFLIASGTQPLTSPSWTPDGGTILFVTELSGLPQLHFSSSIFPTDGHQGTQLGDAPAGLFTPEVAPSSRAIAASALRADGYHIGVAPIAAPRDGEIVGLPANSGFPALPAPAPADSQQLAPGDYHAYSALRSALPRYWYPVIESAPGSGTRLGAGTSGSDVVGRHLYSAFAAVPTTGRYPVGVLAYRYAGLRRPYVDLNVSQDYTSEGRLVNGGTSSVVGTLLRRSQDVSLAATFARPRVRTYASLSAGVGLERRDFRTEPGALLVQLDSVYARSYLYPRLFVGAQWTNVQRPPLSISPEDGLAFAVTARERLRTDIARRSASASVVGTASGYKSLDLPGFAHHVVALRVAGGLADRRAATALEVGGTSGSIVDVVPGYTVGEGRRTFGVRGFPEASIYGTRAATGTLEYRAPLALAGRGIGMVPLFFERSSLSLFADAGTASCAASPLYRGICSPRPLIGRTIASVGGELGLSLALLGWDGTQAVRFGVAVPVAGRDLVGARPASAYAAFGLSF